MIATERKYALIKVGPGDWLLPSNDAQTLWRISRYEDEGSCWGVWVWPGPGIPSNFDETFLEWEHWQFYEGRHDSRQESISRALEIER